MRRVCAGGYTGTLRANSLVERRYPWCWLPHTPRCPSATDTKARIRPDCLLTVLPLYPPAVHLCLQEQFGRGMADKFSKEKAHKEAKKMASSSSTLGGSKAKAGGGGGGGGGGSGGGGGGGDHGGGGGKAGSYTRPFPSFTYTVTAVRLWFWALRTPLFQLHVSQHICQAVALRVSLFQLHVSRHSCLAAILSLNLTRHHRFTSRRRSNGLVSKQSG